MTICLLINHIPPYICLPAHVSKKGLFLTLEILRNVGQRKPSCVAQRLAKAKQCCCPASQRAEGWSGSPVALSVSWLWLRQWLECGLVQLVQCCAQPWKKHCREISLMQYLGFISPWWKIEWIVFKSKSGQEGLVVLTQSRYHRGVCIHPL